MRGIMMKRRKLFYEYGPLAYKISIFKEMIRKDIKDIFLNNKIANRKSEEKLKYIWKGDIKIILRNLQGVDIQLQKNKATNLKIAGKKIDGIIINPGEVFSFWSLVGTTPKRKGYLEGLVITKNGLDKGYGGGLCQLANLIHYLVLHSPLEVTEIHHHTDALFPDSKRREPFGTGTSIAYKHIDYRFKNTTGYPVQLKVWQDEVMLYGELRSNIPLDVSYKLVEEDHHYSKEDGIYYRISNVYKRTIDKKTKQEIEKELILKNHSKVMYDYSLIPKEEIWE